MVMIRSGLACRTRAKIAASFASSSRSNVRISGGFALAASVLAIALAASSKGFCVPFLISAMVGPTVPDAGALAMTAAPASATQRARIHGARRLQRIADLDAEREAVLR